MAFDFFDRYNTIKKQLKQINFGQGVMIFQYLKGSLSIDLLDIFLSILLIILHNLLLYYFLN